MATVNKDNPADQKDHENDLSLMANISDIHIYHYILCLICSMEQKQFYGSVTLLCQPVQNSAVKENVTDTITVQHSAVKENVTDTITVQHSAVKENVTDTITVLDNKHLFPNSSQLYYPSTKCATNVIDNYDDELNQQSTVKLTGKSYAVDKRFSDADLTSEREIMPQVLLCSSTSISSNSSDLKNDQKDFINDMNVDNSELVSKEFCLILDSHSLLVDSVEELPSEFCNKYQYFENTVFQSDILSSAIETVKKLKFSVEENCIRIWKVGVYSSENFPRCIKINYCTQPHGQSLKWTPDQDGRLCVFTHGNWINNRSWFPSQDVPAAMATWQAEIKVTKSHTVIMSGDSVPSVYTDDNGLLSYRFYSEKVMPTSTLSLAVGCWQELVTCAQTDMEKSVRLKKSVIPYRIFVPESLQNSGYILHTYLPVCLEVVVELLGPHPFKRQDILVVPSCFDSLGMASPSVLYLSQSILSGDYSMCVRLAHEICHTWFGIIIGPKDWTEEWLTEGFCTYLEDIVHAKVMLRLDSHRMDINEYREIRDILKYRTLAAEINNTSEQLQSLRQSNKESLWQKEDEKGVKYVKDGRNLDKRFMQLHYLKGYFLLRHLESVVGLESFLVLIKDYVRHFHGKLNTSEEAVSFLLNSCIRYRDSGVTYQSLSEQWLDSPGLPKGLMPPKWNPENNSLSRIQTQLCFVREKSKMKRIVKRRKLDVQICRMHSDELFLFLEMLLEEDSISQTVLTAIHKHCQVSKANAEVQHRWCELVIKHKADKYFADIPTFLMNHQAMGVYLYGELVISGNIKLKHIAQNSFNFIKDVMEADLYRTVHAMLYGS